MRLAALLLVLLVACGDSGQLGDSCTDGTCNSGLACINDICVAELCSEGAGDDCCPDGANALTDPDCAPACGNAVLEAGERCDTAISAGDGACPTTCESAVGCAITTLVDDGTCQAACSTTTIATPVNGDTCCPIGVDANTDDDCPPLTLDVAVLQATINTELATTQRIDVTLTATNGFMGAVTLTATVVDANQQPIALWSAVLDDASIDVPQNGTASTFITLTIPSRNAGLAATVSVTATSNATAGTFTASSAVTVANRITIPLTIAANECVYPAAGTLEVTIGTTLRWFNEPTNVTNIVIHSDGQNNGVPHEADPGSPPGAFYEATVSGVPAAPFRWDCHSPGPDVSDLFIQPVAP